MHKQLEIHWKTVKRILRYLSSTRNQGLVFHRCKEFHLLAFCDSNWGSDVDDRKSTSRFCVYLGSNLISWSSKTQHTVSNSSTEAEFQRLASIMAEITWSQSMLSELHISYSALPIVFCDNANAVTLTANPITHNRTKHFKIDLYFVRDSIMQRQMFVQHIPSSEQVANILTKLISAASFLRFKSKLKSLLIRPSLKGDDERGTITPTS